MAHFAEVDTLGNVLRVIVVDNDKLLDENGNESEAVGKQYCTNLLGGYWIQTSYNGSFRKNYAGRGFKYDRNRDAFIPPKVYQSWVLNEDTCRWEPPIAKPDDEQPYVWDEINQNWILIEG